MRAMVLVVGVVCLACEGPGPAPHEFEPPEESPRVPALPVDPVLAPGDFRLLVEQSGGFPPNPGIRFDMEPDGTFSGNASPTWFECRDALTAAELQNLTDAVNEAHLLSRTMPAIDCGECGGPYYRIEVVRGVAAGLSHELIYYSPDGSPYPDLDALVPLTLDRVDALQASGACTGCPVDPLSPTCYPEVIGASSVCVGGAQRTCSDANADELLDCGDRFTGGLVQCDGVRGWAPATRWTIETATLRRWFDAEDNVYRATLELSVDLENLAEDARRQFIEHLRFEDVDGNVLAVPAEFNGTGWYVGDPAKIELYFRSTVPIETLQSAKELRISLRERPWDLSPWAPAVDLTIVGGAP